MNMHEPIPTPRQPDVPRRLPGKSRIWCKRYKCDMSAQACVKRQKVHDSGLSWFFDVNKGERDPGCDFCGQGMKVRARIEGVAVTAAARAKRRVKVKKCGRCGQTRPHTAFNCDQYAKSGYSAWCKECKKRYYREGRMEGELAGGFDNSPLSTLNSPLHSGADGMRMCWPEKKCAACRQTLPSDAFYTDRRTRSGLSSSCKACMLISKRKPKRTEPIKRGPRTPKLNPKRSPK